MEIVLLPRRYSKVIQVEKPYDLLEFLGGNFPGFRVVLLFRPSKPEWCLTVHALFVTVLFGQYLQSEQLQIALSFE